MLGKSIYRLIGYALAGAVALFLGGQLLSSVSLVVFAWRFGNITPMLSVWGGTVLMLLLTRRTSLGHVSSILEWSCSLWLSPMV